MLHPMLLMNGPCSAMEKSITLKLSGVGDGDSLGGGSTVGTDSLNSLHNILAFENLSENNVASIEPRRLDGGNEELRSATNN